MKLVDLSVKALPQWMYNGIGYTMDEECIEPWVKLDILEWMA